MTTVAGAPVSPPGSSRLHGKGGIDTFLAEYGLSSKEGVLLLCLAEAVSRIPDQATVDRLIAGTISIVNLAKNDHL